MVRNEDKGWRGEPIRHSLSARGIKTANRKPRRRRGRRIDRTNLKEMPNLSMDQRVYRLRRQAIDFIYDAKKLTPLPRITVRITEHDRKNPNILGKADLENLTLWIPQDTLMLKTENEKRSVVYHEILHTVFQSPHRDSGIMWLGRDRDLPKEELDKQFLAEVRERQEELGGI